MASLVIVTTVKDKPELSKLAQNIALDLNCPFVERKDRSLAMLVNQYGQRVTIVVGDKHISARIGEEEFFFHPSMALLRLMNYLKGEPDRMAEAMAITPGMTIVDCTMGFGTDALVASFLTGPKGRVIGLEASPVVATVVKHGMAAYRPKIHPGLDPQKASVLARMQEMIAGIELVNTNHVDYLQRVPDKSVDVVYFDPMFRKPCTDSASISPLRELAVPDPISPSAISHACRIARWRVVLKEGRFSQEFSRLGFRVIPGGKYSQIAFGIIEIGG